MSVSEGKRRYRGDAYWEREVPQEARSGRVWLSWFPQAGKLQISQVWQDRESGEPRRGKTITLDVEDLALHPEVRSLLAAFLAAGEE